MPNNIRPPPPVHRRPRRPAGQDPRIPLPHRGPPRQQQHRTPRGPSPTAAKAQELKLSCGKSTSRKFQRPWTLKEWAFVERIPKDIDEEGMEGLMFKFQEKFKWTPSEGQLRSQFWYFKKSSRRMREFLTKHHRIAKRDGGGKETATQIVTRLKMGSLRPSW